MIHFFKRKIFGVITFALIFGSVHSKVQAQDESAERPGVLALSLEQVIEIALSENPTIIVAGQEIEKKQYAKKGVVAQLLPQIGGSAGYTRTLKKQVMYMGGGGSGGGFSEMLMKPIVELTKPLYDKLGMEMKPPTTTGQQNSDGAMTVGLDNNWSGGFNLGLPIFAPTLYKAIQLSALDIELAVEQASASRQDLVNQVSKAYYQLLLAQDSYNVLKQSYKQAEDNFNIVNNKFSQGLVSEFDKIRAEVQVRNLNPSLLQAENAIALSYLQLKVLSGLNSDQKIAALGELSDFEGDLYANFIHTDTSLLENNSTMKQMNLQSQMLRRNYEMDKAAFLPNVSLSAMYTWIAMNEHYRFKDYKWNPYSTVGVTVSIPIFTGGNRSFKMKQTKIQMNQLNLNKAYLRSNLNMQVENCTNLMHQSIEQLASNKENVNLALKGRSIAQKRYEVGMGTILELNDSELALTQSQLTYTQSIYNYLTAKADLDLVLGKEVISEK